MRLLLSLTIVLLVLLSQLSTLWASQAERELVVVVTFGYLKSDVERILCNGRVIGLVPSGVDPHDYQLRTSDVELLKSADLIISTGHTGFEHSIRNMVESGEIKAKLVDITRDINGLKLFTNPVTGQLNYHMPVNDPINYIMFLTHIHDVLVEIDSSRRECHLDKYGKAISDILSNILPYRDRYEANIIVDKPHAQYLVEWLGFNVLWIMKPEEDYQLTPSDLSRVQEMIKSKQVQYIALTKPGNTPEARYLSEIAAEHGAITIWVESPSDSAGVYNSLLSLVKQLGSINPSSVSAKQYIAETQEETGMYPTLLMVPMAFVIGIFVGMVTDRRLSRRD